MNIKEIEILLVNQKNICNRIKYLDFKILNIAKTPNLNVKYAFNKITNYMEEKKQLLFLRYIYLHLKTQIDPLLVLYYVKGYNLKQVCKILNFSPRTFFRKKSKVLKEMFSLIEFYYNIDTVEKFIKNLSLQYTGYRKNYL